MRPKVLSQLLILTIFLLAFFVAKIYLNQTVIDEKPFLSDIVHKVSTEDLIAMVFWEKDDATTLRNEIMEEKRNGLRDEEI